METGFIRGLVVMHRRDEDIARIADEMKNAHVVSRKDLRMLPERRVVVEQYERRSEQGIEPTIVRPEVDIACAQCLRDRREYRRHPDGACLVVGRHDNIEFHSGRVLRRRRAELADWQRCCPRSTTGRAAKPCARPEEVTVRSRTLASGRRPSLAQEDVGDVRPGLTRHSVATWLRCRKVPRNTANRPPTTPAVPTLRGRGRRRVPRGRSRRERRGCGLRGAGAWRRAVVRARDPPPPDTPRGAG